MSDKPQPPFDPDTSGPLKPQEKLVLYCGYVIIALIAIPAVVLILSSLLSRP
jgi:hypothetical protein